jgi:ureidoglycolate lyase
MATPQTTATAARVIDLTPQPLDAASFAPFGQVIAASQDGKEFDLDDAHLELSRGTPRFYIMKLNWRPFTFGVITRHLDVTQCLASVGSVPWFIAVAPPEHPDDPETRPDPNKIVAFRIPGPVAVKLHRSTWHAGPFFAGETMDFFNLELSDTNKVDHHSVRLDEVFGAQFRIAE